MDLRAAPPPTLESLEEALALTGQTSCDFGGHRRACDERADDVMDRGHDEEAASEISEISSSRRSKSMHDSAPSRFKCESICEGVMNMASRG